MADLLESFKLHAEKLHKDIKELEKKYAYPAGFFGTTDNNVSASAILKKELQTVKDLHGNIQEQIGELEKSINDNAELQLQVERVTEEVVDITKQLEKFGFSFSVNSEISPNSSEPATQNISDNENSGDNEGNTSAEVDLVITSPINDENSNDLCDAIGNVHQIEKNVEKYLEENNIELDDIVTPYIPRKSLHGGRKT